MIGEASKYYGKLLLFGEYTVVLGGSSLALPLERFSASWRYNEKVDLQLLELAEYLVELPVKFKYMQFRKELEKGLCFRSDIPQGYGCGSSGALIAAIYGDFCDHDTSISLKEVQQTLGEMESFFHGKSSGIDPLVIYYNKVITTQMGEPKISELSANVLLKKWYLLDSGITRVTAPLVMEFKRKLSMDVEFERNVREIRHLNDTLIKNLSNNLVFEMTPVIREISEKQLYSFSDFIPEHIKYIWNEGLQSGAYAMKLCGAGGGGYFLVYGKINEVETISLSS